MGNGKFVVNPELPIQCRHIVAVHIIFTLITLSFGSNDQLLVGITEEMGSTPTQAKTFFRFCFHFNHLHLLSRLVHWYS